MFPLSLMSKSSQCVRGWLSFLRGIEGMMLYSVAYYNVLMWSQWLTCLSVIPVDKINLCFPALKLARVTCLMLPWCGLLNHGLEINPTPWSVLWFISELWAGNPKELLWCVLELSNNLLCIEVFIFFNKFFCCWVPDFKLFYRSISRESGGKQIEML